MKSRKLAYILLVSFVFSSCYVVSAYRFRKFELKDLGKFKAETLQKSDQVFQFYHTDGSRFPLKSYLDSNLQHTFTYGFVVIRNDSILYEKYFGDIDSSDIFPSFSVAKSFVGTLAQIAHQEGKIKSLNDPVTQYLPWLSKSDKAWKNVTVQNVLDMRTGVKSDETYNSPFSDVIQLGFTRNLMGRLRKIKIASHSKDFVYKSVNTQLLGAIIESATGEKLARYLQQKLWLPMGMESDATWQTDAKGTARAFCCLNATVKDFAKLGRLYLNDGNWDGNQILSKDWVQTIWDADTMRVYQGYKNHWWSSRNIKRFGDSLQATQFIAEQRGNWYLGRGVRNGKTYFSAYNNLPAIFAQGMLGQFIYVNPGKKLIIVRMGHNWKHKDFYAQRFIENLAGRISK
ncbi:serine hydrolase [Niabella yanshanensis]|uniref:Serine hydrolase n=1 Tax=Niabella yanshanensis TaxID=577386 RepID=A0ABZ0W7P8_9BACT|nr:serine hydrolase [Niabella yanshanensis]WQD39308.1 serine hydrolase [Niabella yanshanensis]